VDLYHLLGCKDSTFYDVYSFFFLIEMGSFFNIIVLMLYLAWILWAIFKREFPYLTW